MLLYCKFPVSLCTLAAFLLLAGCGGGSTNFDAMPPGSMPGPTPPSEPPPLGVTLAFPQLAFQAPLRMLQAPGDPSRWFVVEKGGMVKVFPNDADAALANVGTFVDISGVVNSAPAEAGLLGMAFDPDFAANGFVFLSYTRMNGGLESVVSRFSVDDATGMLDPGSEAILLTVPQPFPNHNGGNVVFGPDGLLYIGFGDGGGGGDPNENAQDTTNVLGAILRIDVDGATPYAIPPDNPFAGNTECFQGFGTMDCPEIFAWGFRNPWRFSFDRETGELWVGDVGQNAFEEVDRVTLSGNYGWNDREGAHCFDPQTGCNTDNVDPITEYGHNLGSSITGGYVYRGSAIPDLAGFFVFGDYGSGRIWGVAADSPQGVDPIELADTGLNIASFAEDSDGELYAIDITAGAIYRIVAN